MLIIPFDSDNLDRATRVLHRFADQDLSLADAHGIAIMQDRKPAQCWSTDWHLSLAGIPRPH